nr:unnamed protein product [Digitaria exilis]
MEKKKAADDKVEAAEGGGTKKQAAAESPSYRLALRSLFSCRNSHPATDSRSRGCSAAAPSSICKQLKATDSSQQQSEACKRRASVSGGSEPLPLGTKQQQQQQLQRGGSSSSSGGSSFRQLRRLSGCYECHMGVLDPSSSSMRLLCPCPDCGEVFVRQESLQLHQTVSHAVSELGAEDTSRNIIEIIFQSSWLKKQSPACRIERILKVHNTARTLARFEEYRDAVKAKSGGGGGSRCSADGNELLRFHCASLACPLGLDGATHLCDAPGCGACAIIRDGFASGGVRTTATSGRAHDACSCSSQERSSLLAMLVCRVIAGRVKRPPTQQEYEPHGDGDGDGDGDKLFDSVAGSAGVYSNLEELLVFNPRAILPCFVVVYKASSA